MKYCIYSSEGNTESLESYLAFFELDDEGYAQRYLEIRADGMPLRYTMDFHTDEYGFLPEGRIDDPAASRPEFGTFGPISKIVFEAV